MLFHVAHISDVAHILQGAYMSFTNANAAARSNVPNRGAHSGTLSGHHYHELVNIGRLIKLVRLCGPQHI